MDSPTGVTSCLRIGSAALVLAAACAGCLYRSPGALHESSTAPLSQELRQLRAEMRRDVEHLSMRIGARNAAESLDRVLETERWLLQRLRQAGVPVAREEVDLNGLKAANVVATLSGVEREEDVILLGAHYDTAIGSPGANDNASGVALLLATARRLKDQSPGRTVRIVFFVNEENPFTFGIQMGSRIHAERSRARGDRILVMIAVDSVGYYTSEPDSQTRPPLFSAVPATGNFLAFVSNMRNRPLLDRIVGLFQAQCAFPSIGLATDSKAAARADHVPFWWQGYPAVVMSDTSEARDPNYHRPSDVAGNLAYDELARMADGFMRMVRVLADTTTSLP